MSQQPKLTVSGYRGIWGDSLTTDIARKYARAFCLFVLDSPKSDLGANSKQAPLLSLTSESRPTVLIGRDGRESGPEIKEAIIEELGALGVNYIDGDILPTPTVLFAVRKHKYDGAIIITASHNPIAYNGLKFVTSKALFTDEAEVAKMKQYYESQEGEVADLEGLGSATARARGILQQKNIRALQNSNSTDTNFAQEHADHILKNIDVDSIRTRKFKVAVDMINASACVIDPYFFEQLGVELIPLNNIPNGKFAHTPEPLRENLGDIASLVTQSGAHVGFAQDPDADRLVVIDEHGTILSEEYTLALGVEAVLSEHHDQTVVINMSTSQMNADMAKKYGGNCIRTKVGEANVVEGIQEHNAIIGGEGGGGVIYPTMNTARDSFVTMALILQLLAKTNQTVSGCVASLPRYYMQKDKVQVIGPLEYIYTAIKSHFANAEINELDGLRLDFSDNSWIHIRPSNTEPIIRLIGEAKTQERLDSLFAETKKILA